jgi:hypothetical protein
MPRGYRHFTRIERHYHRAVNGAIIGGVAGHAFFGEYLTAMTKVPKGRWNNPQLFAALAARVLDGGIIDR